MGDMERTYPERSEKGLRQMGTEENLPFEVGKVLFDFDIILFSIV